MGFAELIRALAARSPKAVLNMGALALVGGAVRFQAKRLWTNSPSALPDG